MEAGEAAVGATQVRPRVEVRGDAWTDEPPCRLPPQWRLQSQCRLRTSTTSPGLSRAASAPLWQAQQDLEIWCGAYVGTLLRQRIAATIADTVRAATVTEPSAPCKGESAVMLSSNCKCSARTRQPPSTAATIRAKRRMNAMKGIKRHGRHHGARGAAEAGAILPKTLCPLRRNVKPNMSLNS